MRVVSGPRRSVQVKSERGRRSFDRVEADRFYSAIRSGLADGHSDAVVAERVGVAQRTVQRYRKARNIENVYKRGALR